MNFDIDAMKNNKQKIDYERITKGIKEHVTEKEIAIIKKEECYKVLKKMCLDLTENQIIAICYGIFALGEREESEHFLGHITFFLSIYNLLEEDKVNGKTKKE